MTQATSRPRSAWRATYVLSAALGAALVLPSLASANILLPSLPPAATGNPGKTWPGPWHRTDVQRLVVTEAVSNGTVPAPLALAVADVESDFVPRTVSISGTIGVMQLHPDVAEREFAADAAALRDPATNVHLGLRWLARLHERYGGDWELALSHYRGGELAKVDGRHRAHEFTHAYVRRIMSCWRQYRHDLLVRAWIREANGAPRFVSHEIDPRSGVWAASRPGTWCRQFVHARSPDHRAPGTFEPGTVRYDDDASRCRPAQARFDGRYGWTAIDGASSARFLRSGPWVPIIGSGAGRFR